jgi:chaperone modulatory protein CbpM
MAKVNLISATEFCVYHNIEFSFISNLKEFGLVEIVHIQQTDYIPEDQLERLERMIRLHRELEINPEGIDTIDHLLVKLNQLQEEVIMLKNRLRLYEDNE